MKIGLFVISVAIVGSAAMVIRNRNDRLLRKRVARQAPVTPPSTDCVCVLYSLCNANNTLNQYGTLLIDIRKPDCDFYLDVCCKTENLASTSLPSVTPSVASSNLSRDKTSNLSALNNQSTNDSLTMALSTNPTLPSSPPASGLTNISLPSSSSSSTNSPSFTSPTSTNSPSTNTPSSTNSVSSTNSPPSTSPSSASPSSASPSSASPSSASPSSASPSSASPSSASPSSDSPTSASPSSTSSSSINSPSPTSPSSSNSVSTTNSASSTSPSSTDSVSTTSPSSISPSSTTSPSSTNSAPSTNSPSPTNIPSSTNGTSLSNDLFEDRHQSRGCGFRNTNGVGFRIIGAGTEAQFGEFPWVVALLKENDQFVCGGSLIHPNVVLTSAHCVRGIFVESLVARAGEWDRGTTKEGLPHQDRGIDEVIEHEHFYSGALLNDVALLVLKEPMRLAENVDVICLPPQDLEFDSSECIASGWGKDNFDSKKYQVILQKIDLPIVPRDTCESLLRKTRLGPYFKLHESFICAGGKKNQDTCTGDGGGPLMCPLRDNPSRYQQAGIVAWGIGCGDNNPSAYANVALFRDWIDTKLREKNITLSTS